MFSSEMPSPLLRRSSSQSATFSSVHMATLSGEVRSDECSDLSPGTVESSQSQESVGVVVEPRIFLSFGCWTDLVMHALACIAGIGLVLNSFVFLVSRYERSGINDSVMIAFIVAKPLFLLMFVDVYFRIPRTIPIWNLLKRNLVFTAYFLLAIVSLVVIIVLIGTILDVILNMCLAIGVIEQTYFLLAIDSVYTLGSSSLRHILRHRTFDYTFLNICVLLMDVGSLVWVYFYSDKFHLSEPQRFFYQLACTTEATYRIRVLCIFVFKMSYPNLSYFQFEHKVLQSSPFSFLSHSSPSINR